MINLEDCIIIGGMRTAKGKSPFACGDIVIVDNVDGCRYRIKSGSFSKILNEEWDVLTSSLRRFDS